MHLRELEPSLVTALEGLGPAGSRARVRLYLGGDRGLDLRRTPTGFSLEATGPGLAALGRQGFSAPSSGWQRPQRPIEAPAAEAAHEVVTLLGAAFALDGEALVTLSSVQPMPLGARLQMALTFVVVLGLPLAAMIAGWPPARWLIDRQAAWFHGGYYPKATYCALLLLEVVLIGLVAAAVINLRRGLVRS